MSKKHMTKNKNRREILRGGAALGAAAVLPMPAIGQGAFPNRTIRIVVPFPAGATTDMLARLIAQRMAESLGQSVLIENLGGGGGSIGAELARQIAACHPAQLTLVEQCELNLFQIERELAGTLPPGFTPVA